VRKEGKEGREGREGNKGKEGMEGKKGIEGRVRCFVSCNTSETRVRHLSGDPQPLDI
jgi:hypothetical protein